ncbi:hypothetical protein E8E11_009371 [Didymella keratinophila]|nr:hypothetical protein E8E11_009371 [Didymella keratinophila]
MASQEPALKAVQTVTPRLFALPQELRLEIWKFTVTDPSTGDLVVHIETDVVSGTRHGVQASEQPCLPPQQNRRFLRTFKTSLSQPRKQPISIAILQANRRIYEEALPLLYHSVTFCPLDASFTSFLHTLSDYAKAQIRYIKLRISTPRVQTVGPGWNIRCAQIARLPGLHCVEIESRSLHRAPQSNSKFAEERLLWPLLKIKAPKRLISAQDNEFQVTLAKAEEALAAVKLARRQHAEWEHVEAHIKEAENEEALSETAMESEPAPSEALKRGIAANLHAQNDPTPGEGGHDEGAKVEEGEDNKEEGQGKQEEADDDEACDWEIVSMSRSSSLYTDSHTANNDTRRTRTITDAPRESSDWDSVVGDCFDDQISNHT